MNIVRILICPLFILFSFQMFAQQKVERADIIQKESLLETVTYLSSPLFQGRLSGSNGFDLASDYAKTRFIELGLKPVGTLNYHQEFLVEYNDIIAPAEFAMVNGNKINKSYKLGADYVFRGFTGSGTITGEVVFCGYGITIDGYDDYSSIDVKNKIVMVFKYAPAWKLHDSVSWGEASIRYKMKNAQNRGALGIIFVSLPNDPKPQRPIISILEGKGEQLLNFPALHADIPSAEDFFTGSGKSLKQLQRYIDSTHQPFPVALNNQAHIEVHANYVKEQKTQNTIGMIEGSDPELKDEYIVIGAHLDHVGGQAGEIYAPGANDNASGSASIFEIIKAFKTGKPSKRSVIFILFASEEIGLAGSKYFVENPPVDLNKIKSMINIDCIGAGDSLQVGGKLEYPDLWNIANQNDLIETKVLTQTSFEPGADAAPFHEKGIPSLYFATLNGYTDLHCPTDTVENLNPILYEKSARLAYLTLYALANPE